MRLAPRAGSEPGRKTKRSGQAAPPALRGWNAGRRQRTPGNIKTGANSNLGKCLLRPFHQDLSLWNQERIHTPCQNCSRSSHEQTPVSQRAAQAALASAAGEHPRMDSCMPCRAGEAGGLPREEMGDSSVHRKRGLKSTCIRMDAGQPATAWKRDCLATAFLQLTLLPQPVRLP